MQWVPSAVQPQLHIFILREISNDLELFKPTLGTVQVSSFCVATYSNLNNILKVNDGRPWL